MMDKTFKMGVAHPSTIVSKTVYRDYGLYDDRFYFLRLGFCVAYEETGILLFYR